MEGQLRIRRPTSVIWGWWANFGRVTQVELLSRGRELLIFTALLEMTGGRRKGRSSLLKRAFVCKVSRSFEPLR